MALNLKRKRASKDSPQSESEASEPSLQEQRMERIRPHQWSKGQSGNPLGRPPGSGSIVNWLKKRLAGPAFSRKKKYETLAHELAEIIVKNARKGNYHFIQLLLDRAESRQMTEEELQLEIEKIYEVVCKYVTDPATRESIARDMGLLEKPE